MDFLSAVRSLAAWGASGGGEPAELADRLTYHATALLLLVFVALLSVKQYILQPIQCVYADSGHVAALGYEHYAETMCWIGNIFKLSDPDQSRSKPAPNVPKHHPSFSQLDLNFQAQIRKSIRSESAVYTLQSSVLSRLIRVRVGSYQWAPLVLALQALACYLPFLFWLAMQQRSGINLRAVIEAVTRAALAPDAEERNRHVEFAARSLDECLLLQRGYRSTCCGEVRRCMAHAVPCVPGKRLGNLLTVSYLTLKCAFVLLPVAQVAFMAHYTGIVSLHSGRSPS